jgi:hypothetical protein
MVNPTCGGPDGSDRVVIVGVGGINVTVAVPIVWATLVAVTVTVCCAVIVAGAVYSPAGVIVPAPVGTLQVTPVVLVPVTVAVNWVVCPCPSVAIGGFTVTTTGVTWNCCC